MGMVFRQIIYGWLVEYHLRKSDKYQKQRPEIRDNQALEHHLRKSGYYLRKIKGR